MKKPIIVNLFGGPSSGKSTTAAGLFHKLKIQGKESVAIHVRRGDYLLPQHDHFCILMNVWKAL